MNEVTIEKKNAAEAAIQELKSGMIVGLGTGSTAYFAIKKLGEKLKAGELHDIKAVVSSNATRNLSAELDIPVVEINDVREIDICVDGADEFDPDLNLIKGGGGALLQEKIIAYHSKVFLVIADSSKKVDHLGAFYLPVEVMQIAHVQIFKQLRLAGYEPKLRQDTLGNTFVTDNGNYIIDCNLKRIIDPKGVEAYLSGIPGIVESGLFINMASKVYMGKEKEVICLSV